MGFIPDIEKIMSMLPPRRQTLMFSATMPPDIRKLADKFLRHPVEITIAPKILTADTVKQFLCTVPNGFPEKRAYLRQLLQQENIEKAIIFCNRKRDVALLAKSLNRHGFSVGELHGDMTQSDRLSTLERFKADEFKFLAASDVAARGIHIEALPVVINFDVPHHAEDYVHRIGRTGRAGQSGCAYTLYSREHEKFLQAIRQFCKPAFVEYVGIAVDTLTLDEPSAAAPSRRGSKPRPERSRPTTRPAKSSSATVPAIAANDEAPPPSSSPRPARPTKRPPHHARDAERDTRPPVKGMGEDMPAFLQITLR
jgi:superfamily II DNA/RNA helicase